MVVMGAMAKCAQGLAPAPVKFLPTSKVFAPMPAGDITGIVPMLNLSPFGMCKSLANPKVAAATAAAFGVLVPQPCIPLPVMPWAPPSPKVLMGALPAVLDSCKTMCAFAGAITIMMPGQVKVSS